MSLPQLCRGAPGGSHRPIAAPLAHSDFEDHHCLGSSSKSWVLVLLVPLSLARRRRLRVAAAAAALLYHHHHYLQLHSLLLLTSLLLTFSSSVFSSVGLALLGFSSSSASSSLLLPLLQLLFGFIVFMKLLVASSWQLLALFLA